MTEATMTAVEFIEAPLGLDQLRQSTLEPIEAAPGLFVIRSTTEEHIRLFVVDTRVYLPGYAPSLPADALAAIGAETEDSLVTYVVATLTEDEGPIVNLLAPIVVDSATGRAAQVILAEDWPLRAPLADYAAA
jgi:flagellar assembly factor FliW